MNLSISLTTVSVSSAILSYLSCKHVIFSQVEANLLLLFGEAKTHGNEDNVLFFCSQVDSDGLECVCVCVCA